MNEQPNPRHLFTVEHALDITVRGQLALFPVSPPKGMRYFVSAIGSPCANQMVQTLKYRSTGCRFRTPRTNAWSYSPDERTDDR